MTVRSADLPGGLRLVTHRMDSVETVSLGVWVNVGTRHETPQINGISHLLEHMAFKGTERRSARAIAEEIENVGGHLNAYTSREFTAYHATVLKSDVGVAVDIVADILLKSVFDEEELARERAVIVQEIGQANDTPDDVIFDRFQETAFPDQPVGRPVLGTVDVVSTVPRSALLDYLATHYTAPRMVFAAAGNLDHDEMVDVVTRAFDGLTTTSGRAIEPAVYGGGDYRLTRDLEQVHVVLGFEGLKYEDPDYYALSVLSTLLGGGMSSRLFQEIREARGLAYSVYAFGASYADSGLFGVYAGTGEDEAAELVPVLCGELRKVRDAVGDDELHRARAQIKAGVLMSLESTASRCEQLARQIHVYGRPLPVDDIIARIDTVDAEAVTRVARRVLDTRPTLAALGPVSGVQSFDEVVSSLT